MADLVPLKNRSLPAQYGELARVPAELEWLANISNLKTSRAYRHDVGEFSAFTGLGGPRQLRTVTRAHVIAWRKDMERRSAASIRRKPSALSALFDYLCERNAVSGNPVDGVKPREGPPMSAGLHSEIHNRGAFFPNNEPGRSQKRHYRGVHASCAPCFLLILICWMVAIPGEAQDAPVASRIVAPVDEGLRTTLRGNHHALAQPQFDQGIAPPDLVMNRMLLVLKRSPEQERAVQELLETQQDKSSPNYHRWLTPDQFGQRFGPADQDMQTVVSWLTTHGFQSIQASRGRSVIEFSGTAAQVEDAFHTSMHRYAVNGESHWANANDQQVPTALTPVVAGVLTLHNFLKKPQISVLPDRISATSFAGKPLVTSAGGGHALGPLDAAVIYNAKPLYSASPGINGAGATIAVVARSNINIYDAFYFYSFFFGNPATEPFVDVNGTDPGDLGGDEEAEAVLDASWSGALAPGANIRLVVSASTATTDGIVLSELYIIDNDLGDVMTESFGDCEANMTSAEAAEVSQLAEQAAAEGITYVVSSGDSGAAGCDDPKTEATATQSNSVNALASTPFTIAVGGTQFNENGNDSLYWNSTTGNVETALSYIPEDVWNASCATGQCPTGVNANIWAGGGGASAFFSTPWWQSGVTGIPTSGSRYVPDVSLTAAQHDPYLICLHNSCQPNPQRTVQLYAVYGTSAPTQVFGGIMALVVQKTASRQGQANASLYKLGAMESLSQCNASVYPALTPAAGCIFNDVTTGNNGVPGETGYGTASAQYQAGVGFDLATGLGSVNVANLVNGWSAAQFTSSITTLVMNGGNPLNITYGTPVPFTIAVAAKPPAGGTPTGDVTLLATGSAGFPHLELGYLTLSNGTATGTTDMIPVGVAQIQAHYSGDQTFGGSYSAPFTNLLVSPQASKITLALVNSTGQANTNAATVLYGSSYILSMNVTNATGTPCKPGALGGPACPTSAITLDDTTSSGISQVGDLFPLDLFGHAEDDSVQLGVGQHTIEADYEGGQNFNPSKATLSVTVLAPFTISTALPSVTITNPGASGSVALIVTANSAFTGTISFNSASCSGLPALSRCIFSPSSLAGGGQTVLTVSTTAPQSSSLPAVDALRRFTWPMSGVVVGIVILFFRAVHFYIPNRTNRLASPAAFVCLLFVLTGCGGGGGAGPSSVSGGTPTGNFTVTVQATGAGGFTTTTAFTLSVLTK